MLSIIEHLAKYINLHQDHTDKALSSRSYIYKYVQ